MMPKLPSTRIDIWMTDLLVRIASGGQPYSRSNSDRVALYYLKSWGFIRTKKKSNRWEVTGAGYQHLKSEYSDNKNTVKVEDVAKKLKKLAVRMQEIGRHASGAEYEVSNLLGAYTLLENRINDIGDRYIEDDAKRAGFEYPAQKAPD